MEAVVKKSELSLEEMTQIAREATRNMLSANNYIISEEDDRHLTLGSYLSDAQGVFELYVPHEKPAEANVISRAIVDRITGQVTVELDPKSPLKL